MAVHNFPSDEPFTPTGSFTDSTPINLGTKFTLTASANITGVRFYAPQATTITVQLWADGTKVAEKTGVSAGAAAWTTGTFDTPVSGTTGVDYIASVLQGSGSSFYTSRSNTFTDGTNAVLVEVGPARSNTVGNGVFVYSATAVPTPSGTAGPWFGIDAVVDDLASPDGNVTAVKATATAAAAAPSVSTSANGSVTAVKATATATAEAPAVSGETVTTGGGPATATAQAMAPTVSGGTTNATVNAVKATASATAHAPGVHLSETLPANTSTGRVKARFATAEVLIGDNDGIANVYPITTETVTFTSTASVLLNSGASPDPIVILPKPIVCTLDSQGYMVDSAGHRWCDLIATDDVDLTPSARKWTVTCSAGLGISPFAINVAGGTTVDLTTLIPT